MSGTVLPQNQSLLSKNLINNSGAYSIVKNQTQEVDSKQKDQLQEVASNEAPIHGIVDETASLSESAETVESSDTNVSVGLTPEELAPKLAAVIKYLQKKDYKHLFSWPWTETFAPGFNQLHPCQPTLRALLDDISNQRLISVVSLHKQCYLMFENVAKYGRDSESFLFKYAKKMQEFLLKECQKHFPSFSPPVNVDDEIGNFEVNRKRKIDENELSNNQEDAEVIPKLSKLEGQIVDRLQQFASKEKTEKPRPVTLLDALVSKTNSKGTTTAAKSTDEEQQKVQLQFVTPEDSAQLSTSHSYVNVQPKFQKQSVKVKPYKYYSVGPFSSHAPSYDSSLSLFSKEDSDLLYEEYFGKPQKQFAREMLHFARKHNMITTYFAEDYYDSVMSDPSIPDDVEIPSDLAESDYQPPNREELQRLKDDLTKLGGIDVGFLDSTLDVDYHETSSSKAQSVTGSSKGAENESDEQESEKYSTEASDMLAKLMDMQRQRLSQRSVNSNIYPEEQKLASELLTILTKTISHSKPSQISGKN